MQIAGSETELTASPEADETSDVATELSRAIEQFYLAFQTWRRAQSDAVPSRLHLLDTLARSETTQRMSDLAEVLNVTARTITVFVDALEADGLVRRRPHPTDRRATLIELTTSKAEAMRPLRDYHDKVRMLFADVPAADQEAFLRVTRLLLLRMAELR